MERGPIPPATVQPERCAQVRRLRKCMRSILIVGLLAAEIGTAFSQTEGKEPDSATVHPWRVVLVGGMYGGIVSVAHLQNYNSWWKGARGSFQFADDTAKTLGADKLGHLYFTYLGADLVGRALIWAGLEPSKAFLYSGIGSFAFQLYVEIEDAFHPELGFSAGDFVADAVGGAYPWLQNEYPPLRHVRFKWNFVKSDRFKQGSHRTVIDDYESQYYWLSANLKELFPEIIPKFWPSFLAVAVGYGVKNLGRPGGGDREFYVALDYDFSQLPGEGSFLAAVKHAFNYFHLPSPTIRLTPGVIMWGLRY
jgi:hypothetical protein